MAQDWVHNEIPRYLSSIEGAFTGEIVLGIQQLTVMLQQCREDGKKLFICGNGGSCGNAIHLANDFLYGISGRTDNCEQGLDVEALSANSSVLTCLANDAGYEYIYSLQLDAKGRVGDILLVLSGSGSSPNVVKAIKKAKAIGMKTASITSFEGGICSKLADIAIHTKVDDMQIAEDIQLIIGHICMKYLKSISDQASSSVVSE